MHKNYYLLLLIALLGILPGCFFSKPVKRKMADGKEVDLFGPKKMVKDMNYQEALDGKDYYEAVNNEEFALKCAERMVALASDKEETAKAMLKLAHGYIKEGDYQKSKQYAMDYQLYYPGTPEAKDAAYIAIKAQYLSTLIPGRDQTNTYATIEQAEDFLKKYETDTQYKQSVKEMANTCYQKLLENEVAIVKTYLARNKYNKQQAPLASASRRIAHIKEKLLPHAPEHTERIKNMELAVANLMPKKEVVLEKALELNHTFPSLNTRLAHNEATQKAATKF